jgi:hypothetical protein
MRFFVQFQFWLGCFIVAVRLHRLLEDGEFPTKGESRSGYAFVTLVQAAYALWALWVLYGG